MKGAGYHMEDYRIKMGMRLKKKRKMLNLTQEQMAEKLNVSIKHYGGAERGRAGLSMKPHRNMRYTGYGFELPDFGGA